MKTAGITENEKFNPVDMGGNGIGGNGFSSTTTNFTLSQEEFEKLIKQLI